MDTGGAAEAAASLPRESAASPGPRGTASLLGAAELRQGQPALVVLQAEPAPSAIGDGPPDDQPEKLALARELALDGVPAVLLLPALPAGTAHEAARVICAHAGNRRGADAQVLLPRLRAVIAPHVPPPVLDDIALFLNESRYRQ
jgi:hypothetical protein